MAINIYVDQGHNPGTINAGASGNGIIESEVTYWVGIYLAGFLYADPRFAVREMCIRDRAHVPEHLNRRLPVYLLSVPQSMPVHRSAHRVMY